jgi:hypothetical protein
MSKEKLNHVLNLIQNEKALEAQNVFNEIVPQETIEYLMVKGKLELKFQKWGSAINAFTKVTELDPENTEAKNHLHLIQNILNFWNPEMFNP